MYHNFFIHSSANGHLGCFRVLAIVNCAAMNNGIHVSFSILVSSGCMPRSGIARSYGGFIPSFLRSLHTARQIFVSKVMSLLFNMLSKLIIGFLPRSKQAFNFTAAVHFHSDFGAHKKKICHCFHFPPTICHEVMGLDAIILVF